MKRLLLALALSTGCASHYIAPDLRDASMQDKWKCMVCGKTSYDRDKLEDHVSEKH